MRRLILGALFVLMSISVAALSQDNACPTIVRTALTTAQNVCSDVARNQACYGNLSLTAEPQPDVEMPSFDAPGDMVNVADIRSLRLSGMDENVSEWGISLLNLQANLPNTLPGQNVRVLLFGNVDLRPADPQPTIDVKLVGEPEVARHQGGPFECSLSQIPSSRQMAVQPMTSGCVLICPM